MVDRDVMGIARQAAEARRCRSPRTEQAEARRLLDRLAATVRAAAAVFMTEDARAARQLVAEKEVFRDLETRRDRRRISPGCGARRSAEAARSTSTWCAS